MWKKIAALIGAMTVLIAQAQTYCEQQYKELQGYAIAAKAEQIPPEQRINFEAQLTPEQRMGLMAARAGHQLGAGINNAFGGNYRDNLTDVFNRKLIEFKKKCGFMLQ